MKIYCEAHIIEPELRENLADCIKIIGGEPKETNGSVWMSYEGKPDNCHKFVELFEQYGRHAIFSVS